MQLDDPIYLLRKYKSFLPSKMELAARTLFGSSEEIEAAQALFAIAPNGEEHARIVLSRLYPEGSFAGELAAESPAGKLVEELIAAQPDETAEPDDLIELRMAPIIQAAETPVHPVEPVGESLSRLANYARVEAPPVEEVKLPPLIIRPTVAYNPPAAPEHFGREYL